MGGYTFIISEAIGFICYFIVLCVLYFLILAWIIPTEKHADIFKYGSIVCAVLGCLTIWGSEFNRIK